jgi:hypothetical protein
MGHQYLILLRRQVKPLEFGEHYLAHGLQK